MSVSEYKHSQPGMLMETVGDDKEIFLQLIDIFFSESAEKFEKVREAAKASNFEQLGRQCHALKGTVGPLGTDRLVQLLLEIEDECDHGACVCDEQRIALVAKELESACEEVRHYVANM